MPAPRKGGKWYTVGIRVPENANKQIVDYVNGMGPELRWEVLAAYAVEHIPDSLIVAADCSRCNDPITAAEPVIIWEGQRICESCYLIALSAKKAK